MLVICEDCAKKYNIDPDKIKGQQARFSCHQCGHIILVDKPKSTSRPQESDAAKENIEDLSTASVEEDEVAPEKEAEDAQPKVDSDKKKEKGSQKKVGKGMPIALHLFFALTIAFLTLAGALGYLYLQYIPNLLYNQIDLRTSSIATAFQGVVQKPLLVRNYLQVNKEAERFSKLPGVAYTVVLNSKKVMIAGFFSDLDRFNSDFAKVVRTKGFPVKVLDQQPVAGSLLGGTSGIVVGGQKIHDKKLPLDEAGGEIHVGVYVSEIDNTVAGALFSPLALSLLGLVFSSGLLAFILLARFISRPLHQLTDVVNRISLGELDLQVEPKGPREIRDLSIAFERMRYSIKTALDRLRSR